MPIAWPAARSYPRGPRRSRDERSWPCWRKSAAGCRTATPGWRCCAASWLPCCTGRWGRTSPRTMPGPGPSQLLESVTGCSRGRGADSLAQCSPSSSSKALNGTVAAAHHSRDPRARSPSALLLRHPGDIGAADPYRRRSRRPPVTEVAMSRFPRGRQLLCAIPVALQACGGGGSTGPAPKPARLSNPDSTAAQLQSLTAPFETDAFLNFAALHQHTGPAGAALAATLSPMVAPAVTTPVVAPGRVWRSALVTSPVASAIFRDTVRGKTFVWDTTAARYVTSTAAGAPANGVRFVLYTTQPPISEPSRPLTAMGYADLTDQSTSSAAVLGVAVLGGTGPNPVTYVSYTVAGP